MLFCSLVAMTVAEDMPHPDSHRTLLDRHAAFPPYGESRVAQPQEGNGSSWSCVPVPVPVPGVRGGSSEWPHLGSVIDSTTRFERGTSEKKLEIVVSREFWRAAPGLFPGGTRELRARLSRRLSRHQVLAGAGLGDHE